MSESIVFELGYALIPLVHPQQGSDLLDRVKLLRRLIAVEYGYVFHSVRFRDNMKMKPNAYNIRLEGAEVTWGTAYADQFLALDPGGARGNLHGLHVKEPVFGLPAIWIPTQEKARAETLGFTVVDATAVLVTHLSEVVQRRLIPGN